MEEEKLKDESLVNLRLNWAVTLKKPPKLSGVTAPPVCGSVRPIIVPPVRLDIPRSRDPRGRSPLWGKERAPPD
jgi:hypothetical protein